MASRNGNRSLAPAVLGKDKTIEVLAEIFHHVVALCFDMHQHIQTKAFLLDDRLLNVFADAGAVAVAVKPTLFEIQTQAADLGSLWERPYSRRGPGG